MDGQPMARREYPALVGQQSPRLLILMAGAGDDHLAFEANGVIADARAANCSADIWCVDANMDYFTDQTVRERLHHEVVMAAQARGYQHIWMGGISLGGFASLIYAQAYPSMLRGLALVAPYIGNRGTLVEIESAGGLDHWQPIDLMEHDERHVWLMLKNYRPSETPGDESRLLPLHLLYGDQDRFARFHALLASRLTPDAVTVIPGKHDWQAWTPLWAAFFRSRAMEAQELLQSMNHAKGNSPN
jgi:pimeloyl-ACP methyl ester carboxylesterase